MSRRGKEGEGEGLGSCCRTEQGWNGRSIKAAELVSPGVGSDPGTATQRTACRRRSAASGSRERETAFRCVRENDLWICACVTERQRCREKKSCRTDGASERASACCPLAQSQTEHHCPSPSTASAWHAITITLHSSIFTQNQCLYALLYLLITNFKLFALCLHLASPFNSIVWCIFYNLGYRLI